MAGKENYNKRHIIGNINLIAGRYKTKQDAEALRKQALSIKIP
jgi:hypothetical protein